MKEIKFRGKTEKGKWVYGYYFKAHAPTQQGYEPRHFIIDKDFSIVQKSIHDDEFQIEGGGIIEVIPETVGQYTGLKDKNGKEIYEGDIVKARKNSKPLGVIWYDVRAMGWVIGKECCRFILFKDWKKLEVIGNTHDNPELLEKE